MRNNNENSGVASREKFMEIFSVFSDRALLLLYDKAENNISESRFGRVHGADC